MRDKPRDSPFGRKEEGELGPPEDVRQAMREMQEMQEGQDQPRGGAVPQMPGAEEEYARKPLSGKEFVNQFSYMLEPYIEGTEHEEHFKHFKTMLSNILPMANIRRKDIPRMLNYFDCFFLWLKDEGISIPPMIWDNARMILELQLSRSVDALQSKLQHGVGQPREPKEEEKKKEGFWSLFK